MGLSLQVERAPDGRSIVRPLFRCKTIDQRQPVQAFLETAGEVVIPALAAQAAALTHLLHGQALHQDIMNKSRSIGTQFALGAVEPQHGPALTLGDRLTHLRAIDIFACGIYRLRSAFGPFPIALERAAAPILRLVDLPV